MNFPLNETREALRNMLPEIDGRNDNLACMYMPDSHARALEFDATLVVGIRGAGKSFWWDALQESERRAFVINAFPESRLHNINISVGFGLTNNPAYPDKATIRGLLDKGIDPNCIWKAVIGVALDFSGKFGILKDWRARALWIKSNPEDYARLLYTKDNELQKSREKTIVLFDALDRLADDWASLRPIAKALFQVALDIASCRSIRCKLFVRPDMIEDSTITSFPDAAKLLAKRAELKWNKEDLYSLLFQCIGNDEKHGKSIREVIGIKWKSVLGKSVLPFELRDEVKQKEIFHAITGPTMASGNSGHKRGFPYTWLSNHLADGRNQVSPRTFFAALKKACEVNRDSPEWRYPLHYRSLLAGVQWASDIRVREIKEDYPWLEPVMKPLALPPITVPCEQEVFLERWESERTVEMLNAKYNSKKKSDEIKLLPLHLEDGGKGLIEDLISLRVIDKLSDGRIQMPDVYRIAFKLGRKGGVKPAR